MLKKWPIEVNLERVSAAGVTPWPSYFLPFPHLLRSAPASRYPDDVSQRLAPVSLSDAEKIRTRAFTEFRHTHANKGKTFYFTNLLMEVFILLFRKNYHPNFIFCTE